MCHPVMSQIHRTSRQRTIMNLWVRHPSRHETAIRLLLIVSV